MTGGLRIFLGGDVMTGRGVDQILGHPGDARLWEPTVRDAREYVRLAERAHGAVPWPVADAWPWGEALAVLDEWATDVRLVNLETSVTTSDAVAPGKAVHYRMAPPNAGCLTAARLDAVCLANNHVLDFGRRGLVETLDTLAAAGIAVTGAGRDATGAGAPAIVAVPPAGRVVVVGVGDRSSGIPPQWTATVDGPGVHLLRDLGPDAVRETVGLVRAATGAEHEGVKRPGDVVVVSIHWGSNWGYDVPAEHVEFAHGLVDAGVDIVHGHSSHHPRPVELYRRRLILYGCGDLIDDYEGIGGYGEYRDDLRLLYLATVDPGSGRLTGLRILPLQARRLRLHRCGAADTEFVCRTLNGMSASPPFVVAGDGVLELAGAIR
jgi:poly-gamma-glutamate synthesis protein (capsule biosynthesis protein)